MKFVLYSKTTTKKGSLEKKQDSIDNNGGKTI